MSNHKSHFEKTAAESKSVGFDFQYYFFLWRVLLLQPSESVGLEVKDDVHTSLGNNYQVLYQLKHTIQKNSKNTPVNMTTLDLDLWKTFSNWSKVICDTNDGRNTKLAQLEFIKKTSFVLASNKSSNNSNGVVRLICQLQGDSKKVDDVRDEFQTYKEKTSNSIIKGYIDDVLNLGNQVLEKFLLNTFFHLDDDDIIKKCTDAIKAKMIPQNKIEKAFREIDSVIRSDNFLKVKEGTKIEITFDILYKKYRRVFDQYRNGSLDVQEYKGILPDNLADQIFIKQLIEIGFVENIDFERIAKLTRYKIKLLTNLNNWKIDGNITELEIERFKNNAITLWENEFNIKNIGNIAEEEFNKKGLEVLGTVLKESLNLANQNLDLDLSNGEFYSLSDVPIIGWRQDWEKHKL